MGFNPQPKHTGKRAGKRTGLKKKLDKVFSEFIRLRDSNEQGYSTCCTCGAIKKWSGTGDMHAGHYQTRGHTSTRWDEKNVNAQCKKCNTYRGGKQDLHMLYIDKKYGAGTSEMLRYKATGTTKFQDWELKEKVEYYTQKVEELKKEKGL